MKALIFIILFSITANAKRCNSVFIWSEVETAQSLLNNWTKLPRPSLTKIAEKFQSAPMSQKIIEAIKHPQPLRSNSTKLKTDRMEASITVTYHDYQHRTVLIDFESLHFINPKTGDVFKDGESLDGVRTGFGEVMAGILVGATKIKRDWDLDYVEIKLDTVSASLQAALEQLGFTKTREEEVLTYWGDTLLTKYYYFRLTSKEQ